MRCRFCALRNRADVVVHVEEVHGIVFRLELLERPIIGSIRGGDRVAGFVICKIVHVAITMKGCIAAKEFRAQAVQASLSFLSIHSDSTHKLYPTARCGNAVSVTPTRVTAPWK